MDLRKHFYFLLFNYCFGNLCQDFDPSMISQLTPEQIEIAKELYENSETTIVPSEEPSPINESLVN